MTEKFKVRYNAEGSNIVLEAYLEDRRARGQGWYAMVNMGNDQCLGIPVSTDGRVTSKVRKKVESYLQEDFESRLRKEVDRKLHGKS